MTKPKADDRITSEGHKLIVELMTQLAGGETMSPESKKRWLTCLTQLYSAKNIDQAAERLINSLNLTFKSGRPEGDIEGFIYEIEYFALQLGNKAKSFERYADEYVKEVGTVKNKYYSHIRKDPDWANRIRKGAKEHFEQGRPFQKTYPTGISLLFLSKKK